MSGKEQAPKVSEFVTPELVLAGLLREARGETEGSTANSRISAWEKLGKHVGIFEKDNAQRGPILPSQIMLVAPDVDEGDVKVDDPRRDRDPAQAD